MVSPNGETEFRLFVATQRDRPVIRLAYQVFFRGRAAIDTSFLGLDIWDQEPLLGESTGLIASRTESRQDYHSLVARYMQNGSLGRLLELEVRAYDGGVAFRYVIPQSTPLRELLIADEATEFAFPVDVKAPGSLPFVVQEPGVGWVAISEAGAAGFPAMHLQRWETSVLMGTLARRTDDPKLAFAGAAPLTCPWRTIRIGVDRARVETALPLGM